MAITTKGYEVIVELDSVVGLRCASADESGRFVIVFRMSDELGRLEVVRSDDFAPDVATSILTQ